MKYTLIFLLALLTIGACQQPTDKKSESIAPGETSASATLDLNDPKLANVQQASQMMNSILAKKTTLNQLLTDQIKEGGGDASIVLKIGKPLENIRPSINKYEEIIKNLEAGKKVDFLSQKDIEKLNYRKLGVAEALVDSLVYISSLLDQILDDVTMPQ